MGAIVVCACSYWLGDTIDLKVSGFGEGGQQEKDSAPKPMTSPSTTT
jgi:hypothetical protein